MSNAVTKYGKGVSRNQGGRDSRHLMRYLKAKAGLDPKEIAHSEHVSIATVKDSIQRIEAYENQNSEGQLQLAVRDLVISVVPQAKDTIQGLLTATELVEAKNLKTGLQEHIRVEDKVTRLEAGRLVKDLIIGLQPKGPGVAVQVNNNNQPSVNIGSAETTEERMKRLRAQAQAHNLLAPVVTAVPDHIDQGEDSPDDEHDNEDDDEEGE
jgi:hypothetical protein